MKKKSSLKAIAKKFREFSGISSNVKKILNLGTINVCDVFLNFPSTEVTMAKEFLILFVYDRNILQFGYVCIYMYI